MCDQQQRGSPCFFVKKKKSTKGSIMKIKIELDYWYARGLVNTGGSDYDPLLENNSNQRCCLGFCALAHGASDVRGKPTPADVCDELSDSDWMLWGVSTSELANLAIELNDGIHPWNKQPLEVRMGNLITVFAEGGDGLEFVS